MVRMPRNPVGDVVYHVFNRSNGREQIFYKEKDYEAFLKILLGAKEKYPIKMFALCLMPNHWNFSLSAEDGENISNFLRWITHTHMQTQKVT